MPIRPLLQANSGVFSPKDIRAITDAFEAVLKDLGLKDLTDPATTMLAKLMIEVAQQGQFTAASLRTRVLKEMLPKWRLS